MVAFLCVLVVWSRVFSVNWFVFFSVAIGCFLCFVLAFGVVCWCFFVFVCGVVACVFGDFLGEFSVVFVVGCWCGLLVFFVGGDGVGLCGAACVDKREKVGTRVSCS